MTEYGYLMASKSAGAPCALLRSATGLDVVVAAGGLPPASAPPVLALDEDGCPAATPPLPAAGVLLALPAAACAPNSPGMDPSRAASAQLLDSVPASAPAAPPAACADSWPGLSQAAGALGQRHGSSAFAVPASSAAATLGKTGSA